MSTVILTNQNLEKYKQQLIRCGVPVIIINDTTGRVEGKLEHFKFRFQNYYWVVEGKVPLDIAKSLYYDSVVGRTDIRVSGHCMRPSPEKMCIWKDSDGKLLVEEKDYNECKTISEESDWYKDYIHKIRLIEEVPENERIGYVDLYHIDSELGLYIFVETIKKGQLNGKD